MCNPILAAIRHPGISSTVHTAGVAFGLSALLLSSARIFEVVRLAGAAYLIYLGATTLWQARRAAAPAESGLPAQRAVITRATAFRQDFLSTTLNPKPALFFATYLPSSSIPTATSHSRSSRSAGSTSWSGSSG